MTTVKARLTQLEKRRGKGRGKVNFVVFDDPADPDQVTVNGQKMIRAEYQAWHDQQPEDVIIIIVSYEGEKQPPDSPQESPGLA